MAWRVFIISYLSILKSTYYLTRIGKQCHKAASTFLVFALPLQSCSIDSSLEYGMNNNTRQKSTEIKYRESSYNNIELANNTNDSIKISNTKNMQDQSIEDNKGSSFACKYFGFFMIGLVVGFIIGFIPLYIIDKEAIIVDKALYKVCTDANSTLSQAVSVCQSGLASCQQAETSCLNLKNDFCALVYNSTCPNIFPNVQDGYNRDC
jgi:hypothetical protein